MKTGQIYVFFTISDYSGFISVNHSCIHLVASVLWSSEVLTPSCNIFAFYLLYNRKEINSVVFLDDYLYLCTHESDNWRIWHQTSTLIPTRRGCT